MRVLSVGWTASQRCDVGWIEDVMPCTRPKVCSAVQLHYGKTHYERAWVYVGGGEGIDGEAIAGSEVPPLHSRYVDGEVGAEVFKPPCSLLRGGFWAEEASYRW